MGVFLFDCFISVAITYLSVASIHSFDKGKVLLHELVKNRQLSGFLLKYKY